jgi:outer membrane protein assembly factor BamB
MGRTAARCALLAAALAATGCAEKELILTGERFDLRADLSASVPEEGKPAPVDATSAVANRAIPVSLPAIQSGADWPQRAANARHVPPHGALSSSPQRVWSAAIGAGNDRRNRITAQPVVAGGRVFAMDAAETVTALSTSGGLLWQRSLQPDFDSSTLSGGGLALGEGRLFAATGFGEVIAMDPATGAVQWRQRLPSPAAGAPTVDGGRVFVVARDSTAWAINAATGRVEWQIGATPSPSGLLGSGVPAVAGALVVLPASSGEVTAVETATGTPAWQVIVAGERRGRSISRITDITGDPVVLGATTIIGNQSGRTAAVDSATGERRWTADTAAYGPVLPAGNALFLINDEAQLVRLDAATGETVWQVDMPLYLENRPKRENRRTGITAHYGPLLAGGRLVVVSSDGLLRLFNPADGTLVGGTEIPGGAAAPPALAGGTLFVPGMNGQLHAFR